MRKLTKSVVTALSLATATLSVIPQAAAPAEAATQTKTSKEYKDGANILMSLLIHHLGLIAYGNHCGGDAARRRGDIARAKQELPRRLLRACASMLGTFS